MQKGIVVAGMLSLPSMNNQVHSNEDRSVAICSSCNQYLPPHVKPVLCICLHMLDMYNVFVCTCTTCNCGIDQNMDLV